MCDVDIGGRSAPVLHGVDVPLPPDRFELRPVEQHIDAAPDGAGWVARGESRFGLFFHYQVIDRRTGSTVLENEATLACADRPTVATTTTDASVPTDEKARLKEKHAKGLVLGGGITLGSGIAIAALGLGLYLAGSAHPDDATATGGVLVLASGAITTLTGSILLGVGTSLRTRVNVGLTPGGVQVFGRF